MNERERKKIIQNTFNAVAENYDNSALRFFSESAENYDNSALRFFSESAENLSAYLNLKGNEHLLDVASGTGHSALALANYLPKGDITGIDFSDEMLAHAQRKLEASGISNVKFLNMDMQSLEFPDNHFDAAVCAFGLFFADDMNRQLNHICDKVKRSGQIVITSFHNGPFASLSEIFFENLKNYGIVIDPESLRRISTRQECCSLFESAGLRHVLVEEKKLGYYLENVSQWWDVVWNAGFRRFVNMIAPQHIEKFKQEHLRQIEKQADDKGIWLEVNVLYTSGVKS